MANLLSMATIDAILTLFQRNWSIRRIAKELGLHRDTVARHVQLHQQTAPSTHPAEAERSPQGAAEVKIGQAPIGIFCLPGPHSCSSG